MLILGTMENAMNTRQGLHDATALSLGQLSLEFARLRLARPELIKSMEQSLAKFGQLSPLIVRQGKTSPGLPGGFGRAGFEIIDGFKRYHVADSAPRGAATALVPQGGIGSEHFSSEPASRLSGNDLDLQPGQPFGDGL